MAEDDPRDKLLEGLRSRLGGNDDRPRSTSTSTPVRTGGSTPAATTPASTRSRQDVLDEIRAEADRRRAEVRKEGKKRTTEAVRRAGTREGSFGIETAGRAFQAIPATAAAILTPGDTLIGRRGEGGAVRKDEMSLFEQILGEDQLGIGDIFKGHFTSPQRQRDYLRGEGDNLMKVFEGVGLIGDIALDPLNLIGGMGLADDSFKLLDDGLRLVETKGFLSRRAASAGADSFAGRGLSLVDELDSALDDIDTLVGAGTLSDVEAAAERASAVGRFREDYGRLNGEAVLAGDRSLSDARFLPGRTIREAPTSAKGRASITEERLNAIYSDVGRALGIENISTIDEALGGVGLPIFGGRTYGDVVRDVWIGGYSKLGDGRSALGVTGRLWRGNPVDLLNGRAFNPFSQKASVTLDGAMAQSVAPLATIRRMGIEETSGLKGRIGGLLQPGLGRSGKIWKSALQLSTGDDAAVEAGLARLRREGLLTFKGATEEQIPALEAQLASYPLTVLNQARLDGLIRNGGKALRAEASQTERQVSAILTRIFSGEVSSTDDLWDPVNWTVRGFGDGDVVPTKLWSRARQAALVAADDKARGDGAIRVALGEALRESMVRAQVVVDLATINPGQSSAEVTMQIARQVLADEQFGADLGRILADHADDLARFGVGPEDLARAAINALSTTVAVSRNSNGLLSWIETLTKKASIKEVFSPQGAETIGIEARLLAEMENMGLAVIHQASDAPLTTAEIHALIEQYADDVGGAIRGYSETFDRLLVARADLRSGLKRRGLLADEVDRIEASLTQNFMDHDEFSAALTDALRAADEAKEMVTAGDEAARQAARALRDIEAAAAKLEEVHLAILGYRELDEVARQQFEDLLNAAKGVEVWTLTTTPLRRRIGQLLDTEIDWLEPPLPERVGGTFRVPGGRRSSATRFLDIFEGDTDRATKAGRLLQFFNKSLGAARDIFGDALDLDELGRHADYTRQFTRGYEQTEGALNARTFVQLMVNRAHPKVRAIVDEMFDGDWLAALNDPVGLENLRRVGRNVQSSARRQKQVLDKGLPKVAEEVTEGTGRVLDEVIPIVEPTPQVIDEVDDLSLGLTTIARQEVNRLLTGGAAWGWIDEESGRLIVGDHEAAAAAIDRTIRGLDPDGTTVVGSREIPNKQVALSLDQLQRHISEQAEELAERLAVDAAGPSGVDDAAEAGASMVDEIGPPPRSRERIASPYTGIGVSHFDFSEYVLGTLAQRIRAFQPMIDEVVEFIETGANFESLRAAMRGEYGDEAFDAFSQGDLSHFESIISALGEELDLAIGMSGAFASTEKWRLVKEVVDSNPEIRAAFEWLDDTLRTIESSGQYLGIQSELEARRTWVLENLQVTLDNMPKIGRLESRRNDLVDLLNDADMPAATEAASLTAEAKAEARQILGQAKAEVRSLRSRLASLEGQAPRLRVAHEAVSRQLVVAEALVESFESIVEEGITQNLRAQIVASEEIRLLNGTPMVANILGGSADFQVVQRGFADFAADPAVRSYINTRGEMVTRSEDAIYKMWQRRLDGAAAWIETFRDRAVNGWTRGGREVGPYDQFDEAKRVHDEWLSEQALRGFSMSWRGAALADEGAAMGMVAIATGQAGGEKGIFLDALDTVIAMLKSQYVGTGSFSPRNLLGATIENIRQGNKLSVSRKVWAADRAARSLEGARRFVDTLEDGPEKLRKINLLRRAQEKIEKEYGSDLFGAVIEARREAGVTESVLFQEISGLSPEGAPLGWRASVGEAREVSRMQMEGHYGENWVSTMAGVAGGIGMIPTWPAQKFEQFLASNLETLSQAGVWKGLLDGDDLDELTKLLKAAEPFTPRPGVEALVRVDSYVQRRLEGHTKELAFMRVMESHFDYSDLSGADAVARRFMPFWVWKSRSTAHYFEMMTHRPGLAQATWKLWNSDRRGDDPRASRAFRQPGTGIVAESNLGLAVPDPAADILGLTQMVERGFDEGGPIGALSLLISEMPADNLLSPGSVIFEIGSGYDAGGVPIDRKTAFQGPMNALAEFPGGRRFVELFAIDDGGDWYWRWPGASHAFFELLPMMNNVAKVTRPIEDGEGWLEDSMGVIADWFGMPLRTVPLSEQERSERSFEIRQDIEERKSRGR